MNTPMVEITNGITTVKVTPVKLPGWLREGWSLTRAGEQALRDDSAETLDPEARNAGQDEGVVHE